MSDQDDLQKVYRELEALTTSLPKEHSLLANHKNGLVTNGLFSSATKKCHADKEDTKPDSGSKKSGLWIFGSQRFSWDSSLVASYNPDTKMFRCVKCDTMGFISRIAEHYLGTHANAKVFQCPQCPYSSAWSRCVRMHLIKNHGSHDSPSSLWKGQPLLDEIVQLLQNLKAGIEASNKGGTKNSVDPSDKRHSCPKCPYATDRRDLYARHENIHREDKPFHCYFCFKVFNRADHVKKHFLRIHRGYPYDITRIRRYPPKKLNPNVTTWGSAVNGSTRSLTNGHPAHLNPPPASVNSHGLHKGIHLINGRNSLISPPSSYSGSNEVINLTTSAAKKPPSPAKPSTPLNLKKPKNGELPRDDRFAISTLLAHLKPPPPPPPLIKLEEPAAAEPQKPQPPAVEPVGEEDRKMLVCPYCPWKGMDSWCLRRHMNSHVRPFNCLLCDYRAGRAERLSAHMWKAHQRHSCNRCGYLATSEPDLKDHMKLVHGSGVRDKGNQLGCAYCRQWFRGRASLDSHLLLEHSLALVQCPESGCHFSTSQLALLEAHRQHKHLDLNHQTPVYFCLAVATNSGVRELCAVSGLTTTICQLCGCEFADFSSLTSHSQLVHGAEVQPFRCVVCGFMCLSQNSMMDHMALHSGQLLRCRAGGECKFLTAQPAALRTHLSTAHVGEEDSVARCPHCGLACSSLPALADHRKRHHHHDPCPCCRRAERRFFPGPTLLKNTSMLRELLSPPPAAPVPAAQVATPPLSRHMCRHCSVTYRHKKNLILHRLWRHPPRSCKLCRRTFVHRYQLTLHLRTAHPSSPSPDNQPPPAPTSQV
ncbi:hypothetical protein LAZ67_18002337 [Cordylochernes scorpioides]|uniref:C2H2-type domain-containing protein n=1 Tax=Cordylochernes scorpioides TaxID=51811 RepID=A0ABY6LJ35_9ARAC|nr:hypothetical protein LAZ67_18002337 [Cordylochernes scorpioides]